MMIPSCVGESNRLIFSIYLMQGATGFPGFPGFKGSTGNPGKYGDKGAPGPTGLRGNTGLKVMHSYFFGVLEWNWMFMFYPHFENIPYVLHKSVMETQSLNPFQIRFPIKILVFFSSKGNLKLISHQKAKKNPNKN